MKIWECRDLSPIKEYLGMTNHKNHSMSLDQIEYAKKIAKQFGLEECNPVRTPLPRKTAIKQTLKITVIINSL